ncbi:peptidase [Specibacter sp. NPDC057265]|uniref:peptidase n=1 Tax=Specibacter sp. NPDC057265 TaxID=3346075 RepID=UPI00363144A0
MKKTLASLALAGVLTISVGTVAAQAAPEYPATQPSVTVSDGTVTPGEAVIFSGTGFLPGEIIDVTVEQTSVVAGGAIGSLGGGVSMSKPMIIKAVAPLSFTTEAAADGSFSVPVTLNATGTYTLTATGRESKVTVTQVVKVVNADGSAVVGTDVAGSGTDGGLANTGLDLGVLVWSAVGAGALAAGVGTVVVSRRRNSQNA